jgi:Flp pilus assembly pilin Flp/uncharacterized Zn finger protein (UPF0148 family)
MLERHYCRIHGWYRTGLDEGGCPRCQSQERQGLREQGELQQEAGELADERAAEQTYRLNNPGDYECPYCLLKTLKRGARRCPKCQHDIEQTYWRDVLAREEEARRREEEKNRQREDERRLRQHAQEEWLRSPAGIAATAATVAAKAAEAHSKRGRELANWAMWSALGGICCGCGPFSVVGLVLGIMALSEFRLGKDHRGASMARFAVVVGAIAVVLMTAVLVVWIVSAIFEHQR